MKTIKQIERPEVQSVLFERIYGTISLLCMVNKLQKLGMPNTISENEYENDWLNSEYVPSHKWEQWELESMMHINKCFDEIERGRYYWVHDSKNKDFRLSIVEFPSMKEGETINIDEELERNGLHR